MKKTFFIWTSLWMLIGVLGLLSACSDDDDNEVTPPANTLTISQTAWNCPGEGDHYSVAVFANVSWKATCEASWLTLDKKEGEGNGVINLTASQNETGETRSATLTLRAVDDEKMVQTFQISQVAGVVVEEPKEKVEIDVTDGVRDTVSILSTGGYIDVKVKANVSYEYKLAGWMNWDGQLTAVEATPGSHINLRVEPNLSADRQTTLTFNWKEDGVDQQKTVVVLQKAIVFTLTTKTLIPTAGGEGVLVVRADGGEGSAEQIIACNLQIEGIELPQASDGEVGFGEVKMVREEPNYSSSAISHQVVAKFRYRDGEPVIRLFQVSQAACAAIVIEGERLITLENTEAGTRNFTVIPPFEGAEWSVEAYTLTQNPDGMGQVEVPCTWARVTTTTATGFMVEYDANTEAKTQTVTFRVTLKADDSNRAVVNLNQPKAVVPVLTVRDIELKAGDTQFAWSAVYEPEEYWCTVEMVDDGGFLTLPEVAAWDRSVAGLLSMMMTFSENTGSTDREATMNVKLYDKEGGKMVKEQMVTFTQKGVVAVTKITATITTGRGATKNLVVQGGGRQVQATITGAEAYDFVTADGKPATWLVVDERGADTYWFYKTAEAPTGDPLVVYAIAKGAVFDVNNIDHYGYLDFISK